MTPKHRKPRGREGRPRKLPHRRQKASARRRSSSLPHIDGTWHRQNSALQSADSVPESSSRNHLSSLHLVLVFSRLTTPFRPHFRSLARPSMSHPYRRLYHAGRKSSLLYTNTSKPQSLPALAHVFTSPAHLARARQRPSVKSLRSSTPACRRRSSTTSSSWRLTV